MKILLKKYCTDMVKVIILFIPISLVIGFLVWGGFWFFAKVILSLEVTITFLNTWKWVYLAITSLAILLDLVGLGSGILIVNYYKNQWDLPQETIAEGFYEYKILKKAKKQKIRGLTKEEFLYQLEIAKMSRALAEKMVKILKT
jgi:hypothetical protein